MTEGTVGVVGGVIEEGDGKRSAEVYLRPGGIFSRGKKYDFAAPPPSNMSRAEEIFGFFQVGMGN